LIKENLNPKALNSSYFKVINMNKKNEEIVSPEFLRDLFSSECFVQTNIKAAKRTERTGHENGYKVFKQKGNDRLIFTKVFEGNSYSTEGINEKLEKYYNHIVFNEGFYPIIAAHFHPDSQMLPSPGDLSHADISRDLSSTAYGFDLKPINILGRAYKNIDLLLYQQRPLCIPGELGNQLMEELYDSQLSNNEYTERTDDYPYIIAEIMRNSGLYEATIIKIDKEGNYDINFDDIKKFSFSAAKIDFDLYDGLHDSFQI